MPNISLILQKCNDKYGTMLIVDQITTVINTCTSLHILYRFLVVAQQYQQR